MRKILAACGLLLLASVQIASAQSLNLIKVTSCGTANYNVPYLTVDATGTLCTAASVSASISGFAPTTTGTPIAATTGGVTGSLPAGAVVVATNVGTTNGAYCKLGASSTTSDQYIAPNGGWFAYTVGANTQLTCITSTSTTTVNMVGGSGLPTGTGGGGGGSGGGGAVTLASGAVASGAYSAGSIAAGAFVSGSVLSGAYASGALASGAVVDLTNLSTPIAPATATATKGALLGMQYNSTQATFTNGQQGAVQGTARGALYVATGADAFAVTAAALPLPSGAATAANQATEIASLSTIATNSGSPLPLNVNAVTTAQTGLTPGVAQTGTIVAANVDLTSKGGVAFGAMANYGTSPGAVKVDGVNAFVTNTVAGNITQVLGSAISATNGLFTNVLQGNAALSATNGVFANQLQGNAVLSATNPTFTRLTDATNAQVFDPCQTQAKSYAPINISTITTTRILTEVSAKKLYVCSIHIVTAAANNVALFEGTGASCAGGTPVGLAGGLTAASGWNFSANGGISLGNGTSSVFANGTNAYSMCLITSATTQLSGNVSYVSQ